MIRALRIIRKTAKWLGIAVLGLVAAVVIAANVYGIQGRAKLHSEYHPPGQMVDIGTHRMHIHCVGAGQPTVILDSGAGGYSDAWANVMEGAAPITRTCAFDRSGMGWSERGPGPVNAESRKRDLEALLAAAGEPGPFIFGGWSMGGGLAWLYAQEHLDEAAGLIMVDAMPPNMDDIAALRGGHPTAPPIMRILNRLGLAPAMIRLSQASYPGFIPELDPFLSRGLINEIASIPGIGNAAWGMGDLGDLPLVVIAHGKPEPFMQQWGDRMEEAIEMWNQAQLHMESLSTEGKLLIAEKSSHDIPFSEPEVIVQAIRELTERYRVMQRSE